MSIDIDLAALFAITESAVASMVATSGTTVAITRTPKGRGDGTVDPDTLEVTPAAATTLAASTGAVLAPLGGGTGPTGTATQVQIGDMVVVLLADVVEIEEQDTLTVLTCRDPRLTDRVLDIVQILDSSAGAARVLHARPRGGTS
ncbi:MAG: hypothetical protein JWM40_2909 [Frankiales bacterium]|nr:hypothetical protein [Frankiales bacterium]